MYEMRSGSVYMDYIGSGSVMEEISFRSTVNSSAFLDVARTRYCLEAGRLLFWKDWINGGLKVDGLKYSRRRSRRTKHSFTF